MYVQNFVNTHRQLEKIRIEAKDHKKELREAANSAKEDLFEAMDSAGVTSLKTGESEWIVLFDKRKPVKYTPELVIEIMASVTNDELRSFMQGTNLNLNDAMRKYVCAKIASSKGDEDDEITRNFRVQNHAPRNFVNVPEDSKDILNDALSAYMSAEVDRKAFSGKVKDMMDDAKASQTDASDMAVFDFVSSTDVGETEVAGGQFNEDGGVRYRSAPINEADDTRDGPLYIKAERKFKPRKINKKKFLSLVDQSVHTIMSRRFGDTPSVTEERVREVVTTSDEVIECLTSMITTESPPEEMTKVSLTSKRPRV